MKSTVVSDRDHLDHEHHRVPDQRRGSSLREGVADGRHDDAGIQQRRCRHPLAEGDVCHGSCSDELRSETVPARIAKCSTIGPRASAGKKVRPPTIRTTPTSRPTKSRPWSGRCRRGRHDLLGRQRAGDRHAGTIMKKRPTSIAMASGDVVEGRVAGQPGEGRAVVARSARCRRRAPRRSRAGRRWPSTRRPTGSPRQPR